VLDALDRNDLWENTVVVFYSDHGYHLGEHGGLWHKMTVFEESARVPLIIAVPGAKGNGQVAGGLVEMVDLYPTLVSFAGLTSPDYVDGVNLRKVIEDPSQHVKETAFSQIKRGNIEGFSVRTDRWRYIEWTAGGQRSAQLFDEENDPAEMANLAMEPTHAETVAGLHRLLEPIRAQQ